MNVEMEKWTVKNMTDLNGKVIIVTGGNSGLGYESVKAFAGKGAQVILTSRDIKKGEAAKSEILKANPNGKIEVLDLDLMDLRSIRSFVSRFRETYDRLDVLMNNAGIMMTPYFKTTDGFEGQMGTNHLGHFALTGLLLERIKNTPGSRVVNVSSNGHRFGIMDFENLLFENGKDYSPTKAYGRSKLANLLFTYELQRHFKAHNINAAALAAHPGGSRTNLDRYLKGKFWYYPLWPLAYLLTMSQAQGALSQIRASVDKAAVGGQYYGPHGNMTGYPVVVPSNGASHSKEDALRLWEMSEELTGISYKF
jgi:NAD(P)-dependent dehydrogenase (short-subunit alcohol dehydrogenase family)